MTDRTAYIAHGQGASVPDRALAVPAEPTSCLGPPGFDPSRFDLELERCGWKAAARHFDNAAAAAIAHDGETFDREIAAFREISATWPIAIAKERGK